MNGCVCFTPELGVTAGMNQDVKALVFFYKRKKVELELIAKITAQERVCEPSL